MQFTQTNKLMRQCLSKVEKYWQELGRYEANAQKRNKALLPLYPSFIKLSGDAIAFSRFMLADIVKNKGCYLITYPNGTKKELDPEGEFIPDKHAENRSIYEDFQNHFHLEGSFIGFDNYEIGVLITGLGIIEVLCLKLKSNYPNEHFLVSLSYPVKPWEKNEDNVFCDCRISFNAVRDDETVFGDIEKFELEAMGIIEW